MCVLYIKRERVVHLLALRPFNRAEILLRLFKENPLANERDRETVDAVLQSVAVCNPKTSSYELKSETMLNEVNDEWQFYSQAEKSYVKRAINKIKQGPPPLPPSQPASSTLQPFSSSSSSSLEPPAVKSGSLSIGQKSAASALVFLSLFNITFQQ